MSNHWTVAVIFMETKRIRYYDSKGKTEWAILEGLLQYVKDEYRVKNGKEMDEMDAMEWSWGCLARWIPLDRRMVSCISLCAGPG